MIKTSIVAIAKQETSFIKEWIAYHKIIGIEHFYLYDNDPVLPLKSILGHLDFVTIIQFLDDIAGYEKQYTAYNHSLSIQKPNTWTAYIDIDEFIWLNNRYNNIQDFLLHNVSGYDALSLQWYVFGNNNFIDNPKSVIYDLTKRIDYDDKSLEYYFFHRKNIAKIFAIKFINNPHRFHHCITRNIDPKEARINHYFARSENNFLQRFSRGDVLNKKRSIDQLHELLKSRVNLANKIDDTTMHKYCESLNKEIKLLFEHDI